MQGCFYWCYAECVCTECPLSKCHCVLTVSMLIGITPGNVMLNILYMSVIVLTMIVLSAKILSVAMLSIVTSDGI